MLATITTLARAHRVPESPVSQLTAWDLQYLVREYIAVKMPVSYNGFFGLNKSVDMRDRHGKIRRVNFDIKLGHNEIIGLAGDCLYTVKTSHLEGGTPMQVYDIHTGKMIYDVTPDLPKNTQVYILMDGENTKKGSSWFVYRPISQPKKVVVATLDLHTGKVEPLYTLLQDLSDPASIFRRTPRPYVTIYDPRMLEVFTFDLETAKMRIARSSDGEHNCYAAICDPENHQFMISEDGAYLIRMNKPLYKTTEWYVFDVTDNLNPKLVAINDAIIPLATALIVEGHLYDVQCDRVIVYDLFTGKVVRDMPTDRLSINCPRVSFFCSP